MRRTYERGTKTRLSLEEVNVGGKKRRKRHVCCAVLRYVLCAKFSQILEVLQDSHRLFGSRNSPTTGILHTIRHVYRSVWPAREDKPRFGAALESSAHDYETRLFAEIGEKKARGVQRAGLFLLPITPRAPPFSLRERLRRREITWHLQSYQTKGESYVAGVDSFLSVWW